MLVSADKRGWEHGDQLVVLGWHNIERTWRFPAAPGGGVRSFIRQLRALRRNTNVVSLEKALDTLTKGGRLPPRAVALTFDDGYRDNLTLAAPIVRDLGLTATFFLVPQILDGAVDPWWERAAWAFARASVARTTFRGVRLELRDTARHRQSFAHVERTLKAMDEDGRQEAVGELVEALAPEGMYRSTELFMDWHEAQDLIASGGAVGGHTMRHVILARESAADQVADLRESRRRLQTALDEEIRCLAYPNGQHGDYNDATKLAAAEAGFAYALTTWGLMNCRRTDPLEVRRRVLDPGNNATVVMAGLWRGALRKRTM